MSHFIIAIATCHASYTENKLIHPKRGLVLDTTISFKKIYISSELLYVDFNIDFDLDINFSVFEGIQRL